MAAAEPIVQERRALELLERMLDLPPEEREAWLTENTNGQEELRRKVTQLARSNSWHSLQTGGALLSLDETPPPERIGAYRIISLIGSGGMGSVYSAKRDRGDFEHEVAIKLIKSGPLAERLAERFAQERQLLARISHPHIARLFDGGETPDGQPYFIMERIDGIPLDQWVGRENPTQKERLSIFGQICDAVSFAHRNLIIHRDLTPANVLIDEARQARLIDFGIARAIDEEIEAGAASLRNLTMTPGYAAPERESGATATTLSDVYSAGRLLEFLFPAASPDLAAVIAKACATDPEARYPSIDAFARDVGRFAEGYPVTARRYGKIQLLTRWTERNPLPSALTATLALAILVGAGATGWNWRQATLARAQAEDRFDEVRSLSNFMLYDLYDDLRRTPGNTRSLSAIADRARSYLDGLSRIDGAPRDVRFETATAYRRLADVLGGPRMANLGRRDEALKTLEQAIAQLRSLHDETPQDAKVTKELADALHALAGLQFVGFDNNEATREAAGEARTLYAGLASDGLRPRVMRLAAIDAAITSAVTFGWQHKAQESVDRLAALDRQLQAIEAGGSTDPEILQVRATLDKERAAALGRLADEQEGSYGDAITMGTKAIASFDKLQQADPRRNGLDRALMWVLYEQSVLLSSADRDRESLPLLARAEVLARDLLRKDPYDQGIARQLTSVLGQYTIALAYSGRAEQARQKGSEVLDRKKALLASEPDNEARLRELATTYIVVGEALEVVGDKPAGCRDYRESKVLVDHAQARGRELDDVYGMFAELPDRIARACKLAA